MRDHAGCPCGNYEASAEDCTECAPLIDWPARFRTAADAAESVRGRKTAAWYSLRDLTSWFEYASAAEREAIGRALNGEDS